MHFKLLTNVITTVGIAVGIAAGVATGAQAAELRVLAPNAAKEAVTAAIDVFQKSTGHTVTVSWTGTEAITKRVADGEVVDVVVNAAQNIERQAKEGKLIAATRTDFARSGIGVAIPASAPRPDVASADALKTAVLAARTVVVSSGTSGRHMVEVFSRLGIGDQVKSKLQQPPSGAQIADVVASGNADIGFQQVSELLHAKGIQYLGPLPAELQNYTVYSAAAHSSAPNADAAKVLLAALRSAPVVAAVVASGMEAP
jgi:molybdate transport system substrate-binding protein